MQFSGIVASMDFRFSAPINQPFRSLPTSNGISCQRCSRITQQRNTKPNIRKSQMHRIYCEIPGCASSFGRPSDLVRHWKSIHGPKQQCMAGVCGYATARRDKMAEHVRKRHNEKSINPPIQLISTLLS